jgi:signal transduction histidine kinase
MKFPYLGIYGDFDSEGYRIENIVSLKSSESLVAGSHIKTLEGVSVEEWLRSIFGVLRIPPRSKPLGSFKKPLALEVQDKMNAAKTILVFPRQTSIDDLLEGPFSLWLLSTLILSCGIYLLFRYPEQHRVQILSVLLLSTALSIFNRSGKHLLLQMSPYFPMILTIRLGTLSVIFSSWLYLILIFLEKRGHLRIPSWTPLATYGLPPATALIAILSTWERPLSGIEFSYRILYMIAGAVVFFTAWILLRAYRATRDSILKAQLKWILWGHIFGMSPYILFYGIAKALIGAPVISYGLSLVFFPLILFSYLFAFYRYKLMDVDRIIHGSLVYVISVILLLSLYLVVLAVLHQSLVVPSRLGPGFRPDLLLLLGAALVFNPLKNLVQRGIDRSLFPERIGLPLLLMEGSNKLTGASDLREISGFLLEDLPERISVEQAALVLRQESGGGWEFRVKPEGWIEANKEMISRLDRLSMESFPQFWDTLSEDERVDQPTLLTLMKAQGVAIIFPMNSGDDLWGFYLLGNKTTNRLLSSEEIHVIATLCTQAAHMVGNARLMEGLHRTNRSLADLSNRLIQAERIADLGEGAATLAHELKNPLGIVRGSAEILLKETEQSKKNEILGFILEEVDRLAGTIDEFLQFARMSPPSKSEIDLNDLVHSAAFLWESRRRSIAPLSIRFQLDNQVEKVSLDSRQIYQALLNIFTNAEEAMSEGGEMLISTGIDKESGLAWISVEDTGKGIPREHLDRVFDRFFTTKDSGLGLGLTVVRKVMEAHGGSVGIESLPESGTKVALCFPTGKRIEKVE